MADDGTRAALLAARSSYGRLVAWLAWRWRDVAAAEDALSDAFVAALRSWPIDGVPAAPEAWLFTAARRNLLKQARTRRMADDPSRRAMLLREEAGEMPADIPDVRLRLMLVCAHPAVDPSVRPALMLQTVLGVEAARIARLHLVSREAMTKRLVRAKAKIRDAGIRFEEPEARDLAARMQAVLEAIYGAYALDSVPDTPADPETDLAEEALYLARLVTELAPDRAEALGLEALLLYCEARKPARIDGEGRYVPLENQDHRLWTRTLIARADAVLGRAAALVDPGPFQIEAAIQSAHCHRARGGATPWSDIAALYEALLAMAPTTGARLGHAMAASKAADDPGIGLALLDDMDAGALDSHQPWWAVRAHLFAAAGRSEEARACYVRARAMTGNPAVVRHFDAVIANLGIEPH